MAGAAAITGAAANATDRRLRDFASTTTSESLISAGFSKAAAATATGWAATAIG